LRSFHHHSRWDSDWVGPLLLVVALVSVIVLRFFMLNSEKSGSAAASKVKSASAGHIQPSSSARDAGASAALQSDAFAPSNQQVASNKPSTFIEDYHLAMQLKAANKLSDAGQCHFALLYTTDNCFMIACLVRIFSASFYHRISLRVTKKSCCESWLVQHLLLRNTRFSNRSASSSRADCVLSRAGAGGAHYCFEAPEETP
jgi:hypothetical protein